MCSLLEYSTPSESYLILIRLLRKEDAAGHNCTPAMRVLRDRTRRTTAKCQASLVCNINLRPDRIAGPCLKEDLRKLKRNRVPKDLGKALSWVVGRFNEVTHRAFGSWQKVLSSVTLLLPSRVMCEVYLIKTQ